MRRSLVDANSVAAALFQFDFRVRAHSCQLMHDLGEVRLVSDEDRVLRVDVGEQPAKIFHVGVGFEQLRRLRVQLAAIRFLDGIARLLCPDERTRLQYFGFREDPRQRSRDLFHATFSGFSQAALRVGLVRRLILGDSMAQQNDEALHDTSKRTFLSKSDEKYRARFAALATSIRASDRARTMKRTDRLQRTATSRTLWRWLRSSASAMRRIAASFSTSSRWSSL